MDGRIEHNNGVGLAETEQSPLSYIWSLFHIPFGEDVVCAAAAGCCNSLSSGKI